MTLRLEDMAKQIARDIIRLGDELPKRCYRIQFKLGSSRNESSGGGLNEVALATVILSTLGRSRDANVIASAPELADALRELHDFAVTDPHYRYGDRSLNAFQRAAELLKQVGS